MGTQIEPITFKLDISASEINGNKTFDLSGTDRSNYSSTNASGFNGYVQQLYYEVGDNIEISFNSNGEDISFIIFNPNLDISFVFDKINPNYTISFGTYDNYRFGDSSLNAYGVFNSYVLKADTRDDLNTYISSKYNAAEPRNRLQQFNRDDRRFIGNYDYIKSDATRIGGNDSSGVNNDLIIQSVVNDIHIVTGDKQRTSIWGNLQVHGNINYTGILLPEKRLNYEEEKLYINNLPINQYLTTIIDNSFNSLNQNITILDSSLSLLDSRVTIHDNSLSLLDSRVTIHDNSLSLLDSRVTILDSSLSLLDSRVTIHDSGIIQKVQDLSNNLLTSNNDASFNNVDVSGSLILSDSESLGNIDVSLVSNTLNINVKNVTYSTKFYDETINTGYINDVSLINFRKNAETIIYFKNSSSGDITIRGYINASSPVSGIKKNFADDIVLISGDIALINVRNINNVIFLSASIYK